MRLLTSLYVDGATWSQSWPSGTVVRELRGVERSGSVAGGPTERPLRCALRHLGTRALANIHAAQKTPRNDDTAMRRTPADAAWKVHPTAAFCIHPPSILLAPGARNWADLGLLWLPTEKPPPRRRRPHDAPEGRRQRAHRHNEGESGCRKLKHMQAYLGNLSAPVASLGAALRVSLGPLLLGSRSRLKIGACSAARALWLLVLSGASTHFARVCFVFISSSAVPLLLSLPSLSRPPPSPASPC